MKAFPLSKKHFLIVDGVASEVEVSDDGMDLRDYFAAKAMTGGMWVATTEGNTYERDALECYKIADAMMKARGEKSD